MKIKHNNNHAIIEMEITEYTIKSITFSIFCADSISAAKSERVGSEVGSREVGL